MYVTEPAEQLFGLGANPATDWSSYLDRDSCMAASRDNMWSCSDCQAPDGSMLQYNCHCGPMVYEAPRLGSEPVPDCSAAILAASGYVGKLAPTGQADCKTGHTFVAATATTPARCVFGPVGGTGGGTGSTEGSWYTKPTNLAIAGAAVLGVILLLKK